jgi:hypothetical protein
VKIIVVTGSRYWTDKGKIRQVLLEEQPNLVIEGGAKGADKLALEVCREEYIRVININAEWNKYGYSAGPIRNSHMLDYGPDLVLAFHEDISKSKGTKNCVEQAQKRGIPVRFIT